MNFIALPNDNETILEDISDEIHKKIINLENSAHKTIIHHKDYLVVMDKLAELIFNRLSDELADTCKQLGFEPVTFINPKFDPKQNFCATSNTDKETLAVLMFTKYWPTMDKDVASVASNPVDACYDYFWYHNFDNNCIFKRDAVDLCIPLVKGETVSVTYTMFFKNENTVDVPKHIFDQGREAIVKYFEDNYWEHPDISQSQEFSYDTVQLDDGTLIEE